MQKTLSFVNKQAVYICLFGWLDFLVELGIYQRPVMPSIPKEVMKKRKHSAPQQGILVDEMTSIVPELTENHQNIPTFNRKVTIF